ncbi:MAG: metallophosphoesterase family protein [Desulfurococcales archaeon]|nr:metallophosphoesterase family protein [Desulfurococcales archaeon]
MPRILHITDLHCNIENTVEVLSREEYDIIAVTGDLECIKEAHIIYESGRKVFFVPGNMDSPHIVRTMNQLGLSVDGLLSSFNGLTIGGIGGLSVIDSMKRLEESIRESHKDIDVLLSHHPPRGVADLTIFGIHVGSTPLREFIEKHEPRLHLCGHIHEARGVYEFGNTIVVNPGPLKDGYYALIDIGDKTYVRLEKI